MKFFKLFKLILLVLILGGSNLWAQEAPEEIDHSYKPLTLKLNESGSKYIRFIMWHQIWATTNNLSATDAKTQLNFSMRRSRFLAFAQVSPKFLILTHWGINGLNPGNLTSLGSNGDSPKLFLHDAWGELKLHKSIYIGAGLHYWKGLSRLSNQSTLNLMTLDQSRPFNAWHSLGITDQFARHLGIYAKGSAGDIEYRVAVNNPGRNPLAGGADYSSKFTETGVANSNLIYAGVDNINTDGDPTGNTIVEAYVKYNIWDKESTKLPYYVGTYLGKKKVLAIGAGTFIHPNGMFNIADSTHSSVAHFAVDAFLDMPTGDGAGALNAYFSYTNFNYGENYISRWGGTGNAIYGQLGYYIASAKIMPYVASSTSLYEGAEDAIGALNVGVNYFINGHFCKITAEYHGIFNDYRENSMTFGGQNTNSQFRLQLHIFL